ncbi:EamA family transporter RarD [Aliidiomarina quisquiliarum]|uniref:EamA family transporter RarD n=1 Tax=Aliidiomarina quisquiliarum TaxID=2938947 RepID=UPI00208E1BDD|nr:EamA family transporter RarD [Aliidiomarina quisquiliarum]MCO4322511.1 EamA family transporter RarD [Aliidiomarina quisquiliarum]
MTTDAFAKRTKQGVFFAAAAYSMWGIAPIYFKAVSQVPALEILAHRVFWSFGLVFLLLVVSKKIKQISAAFKEPKKLALLGLAAMFIACNWFLFIWATTNGFILDASLGYFINPLLNVAIGMLVFGERLRKLQWVAVLLVLAGVLLQLFTFGSIPWIALVLAGSFATYGALRKKLPFDSLTGLWLEVALMLPVMLVYFFFFAQSSASNMLLNTWQLNLLLILAGVVTTLPLLCFTAAAQRLRYSTLGFFQYIGPSLMFILAVFIYDEPLQLERLLTFAIIWSALALYSYDAIRTYRLLKANTVKVGS